MGRQPIPELPPVTAEQSVQPSGDLAQDTACAVYMLCQFMAKQLRGGRWDKASAATDLEVVASALADQMPERFPKQDPPEG